MLAEKRVPKSAWADEYWRPIAVVDGALDHAEGDIVLKAENATRYVMGRADIVCHAKETDAYIHNFEGREPVLYVVLRADAEGSRPLPWYVHAVTASPYEAQSYQNSAEDVVEPVAMPPRIAAAIRAFVDHHHKDEPFRKRKRDKHKIEEQKFGKEPIFLNRKRRAAGHFDG